MFLQGKTIRTQYYYVINKMKIATWVTIPRLEYLRAEPIVKVTETDKGKQFLITIIHTYKLHCFHINTSDPHEETQVQRLETLT